MLVSFQLASKYPANLIGLFDNLEQLASDPACFEVLVKVDTEDPEIQAVVASEARCRKFKLRQMVMPRGKGYEELWKALNDLYRLTDRSAYFVCNINDEVRIKEKGWDDRLRRYVGLFPDHIYRLRTSKLKFRNYYDFWECGFAPENYAFYTKRWLDICGDWNPCFGPDSSQQYIAYYLGYGNYPAIRQFNRDVPILDISWRGEGVGHGLSAEQQIQRTSTNFRLWMRQVSHPMQEELFRRARMLQAHIVQAVCARECRVEIVDDRRTRTVLLRDAESGELLDLLPYKLSRVGLALRNFRRTLHFGYYAGGGRDSRTLLPVSILEYLMHRYPPFRQVVFRGLRGLQSAAKAIRQTLRPISTPRWVKDALSWLGSMVRAKSPLGRKQRLNVIFKVVILYRGYLAARKVFKPSTWFVDSRRLAWVLRDRDLRWLTIKASARARLRRSQDAWFEGAVRETTTDETLRRLDDLAVGEKAHQEAGVRANTRI